MKCGRAGVSLIETLIALVITGLLLGLVAGTLRRQDSLVRLQAERIAFADAVTVTDVVLHGELRWADPRSDVRMLPPDSVQVRAVRAFAVVCGRQGSATLVRLRGIRRPNPDKDSVLLVPSGDVLALRGAAEAPEDCSHGPDEDVFSLALDEPVTTGAVLIFEPGSYHLANHAFRYRSGDAGRQPLTAEVLQRAWFDSGPATAAGLGVHAESGLAAPAQPADLRVVFANAVSALLPDTTRP